MTEVFKPRANMSKDFITEEFICYDANFNYDCDGGPSIIWDEGKEWRFYITNIGYHRMEGPATSNGEWYIHGTQVTEEIHAFAQENGIDLENLTDEDKVMIALKFG